MQQQTRTLQCILGGEAEYSGALADKDGQQKRCNQIAQYRGNRCSCDTHIQPKDKYRIQDDIGDGSCHVTEHTGENCALCPNDRCHHHAEQHQRRTQSQNTHIGCRIAHKIFRSTQKTKNDIRGSEHDGGKYGAEQNG